MGVRPVRGVLFTAQQRAKMPVWQVPPTTELPRDIVTPRQRNYANVAAKPNSKVVSKVHQAPISSAAQSKEGQDQITQTEVPWTKKNYRANRNRLHRGRARMAKQLATTLSEAELLTSIETAKAAKGAARSQKKGEKMEMAKQKRLQEVARKEREDFMLKVRDNRRNGRIFEEIKRESKRLSKYEYRLKSVKRASALRREKKIVAQAAARRTEMEQSMALELARRTAIQKILEVAAECAFMQAFVNLVWVICVSQLWVAMVLRVYREELKLRAVIPICIEFDNGLVRGAGYATHRKRTAARNRKLRAAAQVKAAEALGADGEEEEDQEQHELTIGEAARPDTASEGVRVTSERPRSGKGQTSKTAPSEVSQSAGDTTGSADSAESDSETSPERSAHKVRVTGESTGPIVRRSKHREDPSSSSEDSDSDDDSSSSSSSSDDVDGGKATRKRRVGAKKNKKKKKGLFDARSLKRFVGVFSKSSSSLSHKSFEWKEPANVSAVELQEGQAALA